MRAVFRHELSGYFTTPVGYVFLTMYALLSGLVFVFINIGQEMSASMNLLFSGMQLPLMLIAPLLTMRLFAEEKRMRTDQLLLTSPVPLGQIVLGKALASLALLMIAMLLALGFTPGSTLAFVMAAGFIADTASLPLIVSNLKWGGPCRGHYVFPAGRYQNLPQFLNKGALKAYRISRTR